MDFQVIWKEEASRDLQSKLDYIAQDNQVAAEYTVEDIIERVNKLGAVPFMGAPYEKDPRAREFLIGNYRVLYRVLEQSRTVEVLMVWHAARRDPRLGP
jgi:toxin ParE1/3/4